MATRIFLALIFLLLSSCSKLSVGVYWADTFAVSQIDDYFTLSSSQKEKAKEEFRRAFTEVRRNEFQGLADILDGIAAEVDKGVLTAARIEHWSDRGLALVRDAARRFEPLAQRLVAEQAPRGFDRFDEEFFDTQEKSAKKLATAERRLEQARRRSQRLVKETLGRLSAEQDKRLDSLLSDNPLLLERENSRFVFEKFRVARADPEARAAFLRKYFFEWETLQKPEFLAARKEYQKRSRSLMVELLASATPAQKKHLVENFRSRAAELKSLSR